ncbi:MAG: S-adenosylmethionine decarboxylase [Anaerolineae bacterium]|nr:S-adenosylmethionine decarboxylase [Anaerolineae bacterium]
MFVNTVELSKLHLPEPDKNRTDEAWGWHLALNLYDCDLSLITSAETIREYVLELCDLIKMRRFGEPTIVNFGRDPRVSGYSLVQLIETSNVCAHFANQSRAVYIDIFSCKYFDPQLAAEFSMSAFRAQKATGVIITRD